MSIEAESDGGYNDTHRAFLQALLARQTITYAEAKPLLAAIQTAATPERPTLVEDVTVADFEAYIYALNSQLSPFDFEIRSTLHQTSREQVFALVNTTSDPLMQLATTHSPDEIAFVKRVLDAMFDVNNTMRAEVMAVTSMQAVKCSKPPNDPNRRDSGATQSAAAGGASGLTMMQAEKMLASLVAEEWFEQSPRGFYSLTPRALMELRGWLMDTYNDQDDDDDDDDEDGETHVKIKFCRACKDIVTTGQRCPDLACQARLHNHCVRNMFRAQGGQENCPLCEKKWEEPLPVGEKAARSSMRRSVGGNVNGRSSAIKNPVVNEGANADGGGESE